MRVAIFAALVLVILALATAEDDAEKIDQDGEKSVVENSTEGQFRKKHSRSISDKKAKHKRRYPKLRLSQKTPLISISSLLDSSPIISRFPLIVPNKPSQIISGTLSETLHKFRDRIPCQSHMECLELICDKRLSPTCYKSIMFGQYCACLETPVPTFEPNKLPKKDFPNMIIPNNQNAFVQLKKDYQTILSQLRIIYQNQILFNQLRPKECNCTFNCDGKKIPCIPWNPNKPPKYDDRPETDDYYYEEYYDEPEVVNNRSNTHEPSFIPSDAYYSDVYERPIYVYSDDRKNPIKPNQPDNPSNSSNARDPTQPDPIPSTSNESDEKEHTDLRNDERNPYLLYELFNPKDYNNKIIPDNPYYNPYKPYDHATPNDFEHPFIDKYLHFVKNKLHERLQSISTSTNNKKNKFYDLYNPYDLSEYNTRNKNGMEQPRLKIISKKYRNQPRQQYYNDMTRLKNNADNLLPYQNLKNVKFNENLNNLNNNISFNDSSNKKILSNSSEFLNDYNQNKLESLDLESPYTKYILYNGIKLENLLNNIDSAKNPPGTSEANNMVLRPRFDQQTKDKPNEVRYINHKNIQYYLYLLKKYYGSDLSKIPFYYDSKVPPYMKKKIHKKQKLVPRPITNSFVSSIPPFLKQYYYFDDSENSVPYNNKRQYNINKKVYDPYDIYEVRDLTNDFKRLQKNEQNKNDPKEFIYSYFNTDPRNLISNKYLNNPSFKNQKTPNAPEKPVIKYIIDDRIQSKIRPSNNNSSNDLNYLTTLNQKNPVVFIRKVDLVKQKNQTSLLEPPIYSIPFDNHSSDSQNNDDDSSLTDASYETGQDMLPDNWDSIHTPDESIELDSDMVPSGTSDETYYYDSVPMAKFFDMVKKQIESNIDQNSSSEPVDLQKLPLDKRTDLRLNNLKRSKESTDDRSPLNSSSTLISNIQPDVSTLSNKGTDRTSKSRNNIHETPTSKNTLGAISSSSDKPKKPVTTNIKIRIKSK